MSTDLRHRTPQPFPDAETGETADKPTSSLSITQVLGGALAAMTAAALGSRLSVAGTVVGAALASVVAAVASALYTASLRRTQRRVSAVWKGRGRPTTAGAQDTTPTPPVAQTSRWDEPVRVDRTPRDARPHDAGSPAGRGPQIGWRPVLVAALLMFAVAAVALTGIELTTGHALSGGTGTTIGRVADAPRTAPKPAPGDGGTAAAPSGSSTPSASAGTDRTASAGPSTDSSPSASSEPTSAPNPSTSAAPSDTPTPAPTPRTATTAEPSTVSTP